jgi:hypothetical protein
VCIDGRLESEVCQQLVSKTGLLTGTGAAGFRGNAEYSAGSLPLPLRPALQKFRQYAPRCNAAACRAALRELVGDAEYFLGILPDGSGLALHHTCYCSLCCHAAAAGLHCGVVFGGSTTLCRLLLLGSVLACRSYASTVAHCFIPHGCRAALRELMGDAEYFLGILPDGSGLAAPLVPGQRAPMQLGRQILAQLAGVPERADWKECTAGRPGNSM